MANVNGPKELWKCCEQLLYCRCVNDVCTTKPFWTKHCNKCLINANLCDDESCTRWDEPSSLPSTNFGLMIVVIVDIILTLGLIIAICMIEIKKRPPETSTTEKSKITPKKTLPTLTTTTKKSPKLTNSPKPANSTNSDLINSPARFRSKTKSS